MKKIFLLTSALLFSFNSFARINTAKCPNQINIQYKNITKLPLTSEISQNAILDKAYKTVIESDAVNTTYHLLTRTNDTLCVYTNEHFVAFLQTNNNIDELMVPYNEFTFFRTKVISVNNNNIELSKDADSLLLFAQDFQLSFFLWNP